MTSTEDWVRSPAAGCGCIMTDTTVREMAEWETSFKSTDGFFI